MKAPLLTLLAALAAASAGGCARSAAEAAASAAPVETAAMFKAGHGVKLTPFAAKFVGLATAGFAGRLPASARLRTVQGDFVYVANGEWFLRTAVNLGAVRGDSFEITAGLYEGDLIVTHGVQALWLAELHNLRAGQACARN